MSIQYRRDLWKIVTVAGDSAEIGVAEGYFSADILSWRTSFPRHYMVDRWRCMPNVKGDSAQSQEWHNKNLAAAQARVAQYGNRAIFLRGDSTQMAEYVPAASLALLYIDGDHSYLGVTTDLLAWVDKVRVGGIIAFHDYENTSYGVKQAVNEFAAARKLAIHPLPEDKMEDAGAYVILC